MNIRAIALQGALFVGLLVTYLAVRTSSGKGGEALPLLEFSVDKVASIEIRRGEDTLVLAAAKRGEAGQKMWVVDSSHGYPVPNEKMDEGFLTPLRQATEGEYIGGEELRYEFGLDGSSATQVKFFDSEKEILAEIVLGNVEEKTTGYDQEAMERMLQRPDQPPAPPKKEGAKTAVHHTYVFLPASGATRKVASKLVASPKAEDWLDREITGLTQDDRKRIEKIAIVRGVDSKEGRRYAFANYKERPLPVIAESVTLYREKVDLKDAKKDGASDGKAPENGKSGDDDQAGEDGEPKEDADAPAPGADPEYRWRARVEFKVLVGQGLAVLVPAEGEFKLLQDPIVGDVYARAVDEKAVEKTYLAEEMPRAGLLDALVGLTADDFLEPIEIDRDEGAVKDPYKAMTTPEILVHVYREGQEGPITLRLGKMPRPRKEGVEPPAPGAAPKEEFVYWCSADQRYWQIEKPLEEKSPFGAAAEEGAHGEEGEEKPAKRILEKIGVFEIGEWRYKDFTKGAFDYAQPEEGEWEDVPLVATGIDRAAVHRIAIEAPKKRWGEPETGTLVLVREDVAVGSEPPSPVWSIESHHGHPAKKTEVDDLFDDLFAIQRSRKVTDSSHFLKKYELAAPAARTVVLSDKEGKELAKLVLGKTAMSVKVKDAEGAEKTVDTVRFLAADGTSTIREGIAESFSHPLSDPKEWVEDDLVAIEKEKIVKLEATIGSRTYVFAGKDDPDSAPEEPPDQPFGAPPAGKKKIWSLVETPAAGGDSVEREADRDVVDALAAGFAGLKFETLADPIPWPEGQAPPDAAALSRYGLDKPILVLVAREAEGGKTRALAFGEVALPPKEKKEGDLPAFEQEPDKKYYALVPVHLALGSSEEQAFAGKGASRALAVYELGKWQMSPFRKKPWDLFQIETERLLVRAQGAPADPPRTKDEARELATKLAGEVRAGTTTMDSLAAEYTDGLTEAELPEAWKEAAYRLLPGEVSEAVDTELGSYVIQRTK